MAPAPLTPAAYLPHLARAADVVADVLGSGDLDATVPGCAPWRLADLARHLGGIHRWARTAVVEGRPGDETAGTPPTDRDGLVAWFREGADALLVTLRATDPATPCWSFGPRPHIADFWFRRQAHETALHAIDAAASQGTALPYDPTLAADGIDEVVDLLLPRQIRLGRTPPPSATLALEPDAGGRRVLGDGAAAATVSGPAEVLLLLLWHRTPLDDPRVVVTGERSAAEAVLGAALTP